MQAVVSCLAKEEGVSYRCREPYQAYLQCRMDRSSTQLGISLPLS